MKTIINLLNENKEISDFQVTSVKTESYELFFVHDNVETVRITDTKTLKAIVYMDQDGFRGNAEFSVMESDDEETIKTKINEAIIKAKTIKNEFYPIPENEEVVFEAETNIKDYAPSKLAAIIGEKVTSLNTSKSHFNAVEVFIYKNIKEIQNSKGLKKIETSYDGMVEAIPTYDGKESVELYAQYRFKEYNEESLMSFMKEKLMDTEARYNATKPLTKLEGNIIFRTQELEEIVSTLVSDMSCATAYTHQGLHQIGDSIQNGEEISKLDVELTNILNGKTINIFDNDGQALSKVKVIEDGIYKNHFGSLRYAHYLNEKPTGNLSAIYVKKGEFSNEALMKNPYLEVVSMSGLQVDPYSDYIGGEVRLGYFFDGVKVTPVTGISISGNLSEVLNTLKLSNEVVVTTNYEGPKKALISNTQIF